MKLFISRGTYDRVTQGMTAAEQAEFDQLVQLYPDQVQPEPIAVDQDRIAARYAELYAAAVVDDLPGPGIVTTAPQPVPATEPPTMQDMIWATERLLREPPPPPRHLRAGTTAVDAIAGALPRASGWAKDMTGAIGGLAHLAGIPILLDETLPADVWQLVDPKSGEVLYEGTATTWGAAASPPLGYYFTVDDVDELADEFDGKARRYFLNQRVEDHGPPEPPPVGDTTDRPVPPDLFY